MNYKLSPSSLSLMKDCPRCFWLLHNKNIRRPVGLFPSLPNGMDRILKIHFDKFRDRGKLPPEINESNQCQDCKLFDDKELLESWRNNREGIRFVDEAGNLLMGAIDNVLVKNGKLIVLDYKTRGHDLREDSHKYYQDQMDIYTFLFKKIGYKTEDYAYLLFYIPKEVTETGEVIFDTKLMKIKVDARNAEKLFKGAIGLLEGPLPEERCGWCELREID